MKCLQFIICRILIILSALVGITAAFLFDGNTIDIKQTITILFICYIFFFSNFVILWKLDKKYRNEGDLF